MMARQAHQWDRRQSRYGRKAGIVETSRAATSIDADAVGLDHRAVALEVGSRGSHCARQKAMCLRYTGWKIAPPLGGSGEVTIVPVRGRAPEEAGYAFLNR